MHLNENGDGEAQLPTHEAKLEPAVERYLEKS